MFFLTLLLFLPILVGAIDLQLYTQGRCFGQGVLAVEGLVIPGVCYVIGELNVLSVNFVEADFKCESYVYTTPDCRAEFFKGVGPGGRCLSLEGFSDAIRRGESIRSALLLCPDFCPAPALADGNNQKDAEPQMADTNNQMPLADTDDRAGEDLPIAEISMMGVVYTEDPSKGSWVLKTGDVKEVFGQLTNVPLDEKALWLQAHGASFKLALEPTD